MEGEKEEGKEEGIRNRQSLGHDLMPLFEPYASSDGISSFLLSPIHISNNP